MFAQFNLILNFIVYSVQCVLLIVLFDFCILPVNVEICLAVLLITRLIEKMKFESGTKGA